MANWIYKRRRYPNHIEPGMLLCECGAKVVIDYDGVTCSKCKQPYNIFGQRLRRDWEQVVAHEDADGG